MAEIGRVLKDNTSQFILGVSLVLLAALGVFNALMSPPGNEMRAMAMYLLITALISLGVGFAAYRLGWLDRLPDIRWSILAGYLLASALTFLNVWFTAVRMFASQHDLTLAGILLAFAGGIATLFGYFFSSGLRQRIEKIEHATRQLEQGKLAARVQLPGQDELARLAHAFNQMAERLEAADRTQREVETLRRDLVAWVGHDLQTPLASMRALVEALADGVVDDPATQARYFASIQREIRSLSLLVDDLFQMAQFDAGGILLEQAENSLADLISDTLEGFSALAEQNQVQLSGSVAPGVDPVWMDARRIGRVLNNLVSNALRHTPPGGTVEVRASLDGAWLKVEVNDSGEGIRPEDLPHIFDRFFRGERSRSRRTGGSGLGLAIAQGILQAHGGRIEAESQPGKGARLRFYLPRTSAPTPDHQTR